MVSWLRTSSVLSVFAIVFLSGCLQEKASSSAANKDAAAQAPQVPATITKPENFELKEAKDILGLQGMIEWKIPVKTVPNSFNASLGMTGHSLPVAPLHADFTAELFDPSGASAATTNCSGTGVTNNLLGQSAFFCEIQKAVPNASVGDWVLRLSPNDPAGAGPSISSYVVEAAVTY